MISLIVAMDKNRLIGSNNDLPWRLPADLAYFKRVTMEHPIVMGRKTFEAIGRPLPGRENIVITRNKSYKADGCTIAHSLTEVLERYGASSEEVFIIGGAELFKEALPIADRLYVTHIEEAFTGDTWFPEISLEQWREVSRAKGIQDEKNPYEYYFTIYERS
ncbi:MAG: dihydrofolate reductase [Ectobacillus sp.]